MFLNRFFSVLTELRLSVRMTTEATGTFKSERTVTFLKHEISPNSAAAGKVAMFMALR